MPGSWRLAAPSFVLPGTVAENCAFLQGRVDEVALCFFETDACLEYGENELPPWLGGLPGRKEPLRYHVHLPLDLPWQQGSDAAAQACIALARKVAFLAPEAFVLHPPPGGDQLQAFMAAWRQAGLPARSICLENTRHNDLALSLQLAYAANCGVCLDFGHALAYGQQALLESPPALARVRMLHLYAPGGEEGGRHRHLPLTELDDAARRELDALLGRLGPGAGRVMVLEVFDWQAWQASRAALAGPARDEELAG